MSKLFERLKNLVKTENPYKEISVEELEKRKNELINQREFVCESIVFHERGYSAKTYDSTAFRTREDSAFSQIKAIDREINKIDSELSKRKREQENAVQQERE